MRTIVKVEWFFMVKFLAAYMNVYTKYIKRIGHYSLKKVQNPLLTF